MVQRLCLFLVGAFVLVGFFIQRPWTLWLHSPHELPALWTVPPCTQTLRVVDRGGQGIFCGSPFILNTFKGGSSSGKNLLPATPLLFLLGMDLGHVCGEPALEGGYSSKELWVRVLPVPAIPS